MTQHKDAEMIVRYLVTGSDWRVEPNAIVGEYVRFTDYQKAEQRALDAEAERKRISDALGMANRHNAALAAQLSAPVPEVDDILALAHEFAEAHAVTMRTQTIATAARVDAVHDELHAAVAALARGGSDAKELRSFIADTVPFLEEAWKACFHGSERALLSCEERGMGALLQEFRAIRDGKPPRSPAWVSVEDHAKGVDAATAWASRTLGSPNELVEELREWVSLGETCADGIKRADAEVKTLRRTVAELRERVASDLRMVVDSEPVDVASYRKEIEGFLRRLKT